MRSERSACSNGEVETSWHAGTIVFLSFRLVPVPTVLERRCGRNLASKRCPVGDYRTCTSLSVTVKKMSQQKRAHIQASTHSETSQPILTQQIGGGNNTRHRWVSLLLRLHWDRCFQIPTTGSWRHKAKPIVPNILDLGLQGKNHRECSCQYKLQ